MMAGLPEIHSILGGNGLADLIVDEEWIELMVQAKVLGLTKEEVLRFFEQKATENKKDEPTYHTI